MSKFCSLLCVLAIYASCFVSSICLASPYAYIPNTIDNTLAVMSTTTGSLDETVDGIGNGSSAVAVGYDGEYVFVTNATDNTLSVIKVDYIGSTDEDEDPVIDTINVGSNPLGVAVSPDGDYAYVSNYDDASISIIETDDDDVVLLSEESMGSGFYPLGIAVTPDGDVFVADNNGSRVMMFNANSSTEVTVGEKPYGVAVSGDGNNVYVTNFGSDTLTVIKTDNYNDDDDDHDNEVVASISVGNGPRGVAVAAGGEYVCVVNSMANSVSIIAVDGDADDPELTLERTVDLTSAPLGIAAPLNGMYAYVTYEAVDKVSEIDLSDGSLADLDVDDFNGPSGFGRFVGGMPPNSAPDNLEAVEQSDSKIELTWENNSYDTEGFKIERCKSSEEDTEYEQIAMVYGDDVYDEDDGEYIYTDKGLNDETTYNYRVRAYNEAGDSDYSESVSATTEEEELDWGCFISSSSIPGSQSGVLPLTFTAVFFGGCAILRQYLSKKGWTPGAVKEKRTD